MFTDSRLVFMGEFEVAMDEKSRVMIPTKWKAFLGPEVVLCEGFDGAVELRPKEIFQQYYNRLSDHYIYCRHVRVLKRKILGTAREIALDKWGRFVIPANFKRENKLVGPLVMRGNGDSIEIWDKGRYQEWAEEEGNTLEGAADALASLRAKSRVEGGDNF